MVCANILNSSQCRLTLSFFFFLAAFLLFVLLQASLILYGSAMETSTNSTDYPMNITSNMTVMNNMTLNTTVAPPAYNTTTGK